MTKTQETSTSPSDTQKPQTPKRRWRTMVAWVLLILGIILTPITVVGVWSRNQLLDTDRYVHHYSPRLRPRDSKSHRHLGEYKHLC